MVQHIFSREPIYDKGVCHKHVAGARPHVRLVTSQPCQLWTYRLAREKRAATRKYALCPISLGQLFYLAGRPGVDSIKYRGAQRSSLGIGSQQTRSYTAHADRRGWL